MLKPWHPWEISFASDHDWFVAVAHDATGSVRGVVVEETTIHPDNSVSHCLLTILNRPFLRDWAGY